MGRDARRVRSRKQGARAAFLTAAAATAALTSSGPPVRGSQDSEVWVAKVNGEPISARLFQRRAARSRVRTYQQFGQKYGVGESADLWTTSCGGEVPLERIRQEALEECVRIKIQQTLARDNGILRDIGYSAFLAALERENERRKRAVAAGEPVYGPTQYREDTSFFYVLSNMVIELKRRLGRDELRAPEDRLQQHYEAVKDELYKLEDRLTVWAISVPFRRRSEESEGLTREEARAGIEEAKARLDEGEEFEKLAAIHNEDGSLGERRLDDRSRRFDERRCPRFKEEAEKLSEGDVSGIFEERGTFYIVKCVKREAAGHMPYDEAKHNVRSNYIDGEYERLVDDLVRAAEVEINQEVYSALQVR